MLALDVTTFTKLDRLLISEWNLKSFHVILKQTYVYSKSQNFMLPPKRKKKLMYLLINNIQMNIYF